MIEVHPHVFIGGVYDCQPGRKGWATVHSCSHPCYYRAFGYSDSRDNNMFIREDSDLYLNVVDLSVPDYHIDVFREALDFAGKSWDSGKNILFHCQQGISRAPSFALLLLARHIGAVNNSSYEEAKREFSSLYPRYSPGSGLKSFLTNNWNSI